MVEFTGLCIVTVYTIVVGLVLRFSNGIEIDKSVRDKIYLIS